jgi:hypothetical protein
VVIGQSQVSAILLDAGGVLVFPEPANMLPPLGAAGAHAAGLQPVHMDPYGFCPARDGHPHIRSLGALARLLSDNR